MMKTVTLKVLTTAVVLSAVCCEVLGTWQLHPAQAQLLNQTDTAPGRGEDYDEAFAYHSLMLSFASWWPVSNLQDWSCSYCKEVPDFLVEDILVTDTLLAYTGYDPSNDQIVAVFRGSNNEDNFIANLETTLLIYPLVDGAMVHEGFYKMWVELQKLVIPSMEVLMQKHPGSELLVAGHSMGAAIAQIAALDIIDAADFLDFCGKRRVHTTGSPRWANKPLAEYFDSVVDVSWRITNKKDKVPTLPFTDMGYMHTSRQVWYTSTEPLVYRVCDAGHGEDANCHVGYYESTVDDHKTYFNTKLEHPPSESLSRGDTYDEAVAYHSLMLCFASWWPASYIRDWSCSYCKEVPGFVVEDILETESLLAYTGYDPSNDQIVAIFRGADNDDNWVSNFDVTQIIYPIIPDAMVHEGFYKAWVELQRVVLSSMNKLMQKHPNSELLVTGHSMGGAIAQIASLDIFNAADFLDFGGKRRVHTTGSPRWANKPLAEYFDSVVDVSWRITNKMDMVPTVPFTDMGYVHTSRQVWYTSTEPLVYRVCDDGHGEDADCHVGYFESTVDDHKNYLNVKLEHP